MRRSALRTLLRRIALVSAIPLAGCPGGGFGPCTPPPETITLSIDGGLPGDGGDRDAGCALACNANGFRHVEKCVINVTGDGGAQIACTFVPICVGGRRPSGLAMAVELGEGSLVGQHFARMAHLEAASVDAFDRLAAELAEHHAPGRLIEEARRASVDEIRHARVTEALGRRYGARAPAVEVAPRRARSIEEIAVENAAEGCVLETYGAVVATWQGEHAAEPRVRAALRRIARDETRHAELAADVDAWIYPHLDRAARRRVDAARRAAVVELHAAVDHEVAEEVVAFAGVPRRETARALVAATAQSLWA